MYLFDEEFRENGYKNLVGTDEAGRGPLAGPVVAAAVIFDPGVVIEGINDSKKLSEKKRVELFDEIKRRARSFSIIEISPEEIDKINILQASLKAMKLAAESLEVNPDLVIIDGNKSFYAKYPTKAVIKGDGKSQTIAAASILAKVNRDEIMKKLHVEFPEYNWSKNKGYPTKEHREAVLKFGVTKYHRKTFLKKLLQENSQLQI